MQVIKPKIAIQFFLQETLLNPHLVNPEKALGRKKTQRYISRFHQFWKVAQLVGNTEITKFCQQKWPEIERKYKKLLKGDIQNRSSQ